MSASPAAPSSASVSAWATTSPSEWPTSPRGCSMTTPARTSGMPSPNACASTPSPIRRLLTAGTLARQAARRGCRCRVSPRAVSAGAAPTGRVERGSQPVRHGRQGAHRCRRGHRRTQVQPGEHSPSSTSAAKNAGSGFRMPRLADEVITSTGRPASRAHSSSARFWLPASPTRSPRVRHGLEAAERVRVEDRTRRRRSRPRRRVARCRDVPRARCAPPHARS